jgi:uncharacterized protein DUF4339
MGIKFHCPNGHKLNVKSFLAGKKGVCPKCGTRVRIPANSEPGLEDSDLEEPTAATISEGRPSNGSAAKAAAPLTLAPAPPATATLPATGTDPIAEIPTAIWYVRPPTGGQYGPARGDIMRKWLTEGRVSSDSLVWREGWTEWQSAGQVFAELRAPATAPEVGLLTAPAAAAPRIVPRPQTRQRSGSGVAVAILVGLALLCIVLLVVLGYLFFFGNVK